MEEEGGERQRKRNKSQLYEEEIFKLTREWDNQKQVKMAN